MLVDDSRQDFIGEDRLQEFTATIVVYGVEPDGDLLQPLLPQYSPTSVVPRVSSHPFPVKALSIPSGPSAAAFGIRTAGGEYLQCLVTWCSVDSVAN